MGGISSEIYRLPKSIWGSLLTDLFNNIAINNTIDTSEIGIPAPIYNNASKQNLQQLHAYYASKLNFWNMSRSNE